MFFFQINVIVLMTTMWQLIIIKMFVYLSILFYLCYVCANYCSYIFFCHKFNVWNFDILITSFSLKNGLFIKIFLCKHNCNDVIKFFFNLSWKNFVMSNNLFLIQKFVLIFFQFFKISDCWIWHIIEFFELFLHIRF